MRVVQRLCAPVLGLLLVTGASTPVTAAAGLVVEVLAVGQGSAALYVGPCGDAGLVDGGRGSVDEILATLGERGIDELAWMQVSHYDADHLGDVVDVGQAIPVAAVYDRGGDRTVKDTDTYRTYYDWVTAAGNPSRVPVDIGDTFGLCDGLVSFDVIAAGTDGTSANEVAVSAENDRGVCLHVAYAAFDLATCGDVDADVEEAVADDFGDVEVAIVNHHGSSSSSAPAYVDTLAAEVAVVSVGDNGFGHPDPDVMERWAASGAVLYQTQDGDDGAFVDGDVVISATAASAGVLGEASGRSTTITYDETTDLLGTGISRLAGGNRIETAAAVSSSTFGGAGGVVLASDGGFADALAGSVLAARIDGPVLLTGPERLATTAAAEIDRLDGPVYIVGGTRAVGSSVEDVLTDPLRIGGPDRYATAAEIAGAVMELGGSAATIYLVTGRDFADAVAAAGLAALGGNPILLADTDRTDVAAAFVAAHAEGVSEVVAVGGTRAVPDAVLDAVAGGVPTGRIAGADRYSTSHAVADAAIALGADPLTTWVATGAAYPDALAAAAGVAHTRGVLHLARPTSIDTDDHGDDLRALLVEHCPVDRLVLVGGTAALSDGLRDAADAAGLACTDDGEQLPDPTPECDPSYPDVCIPPPPPDLDCGDISHRNFAVVGDDPHRFDRDDDGLGCQG